MIYDMPGNQDPIDQADIIDGCPILTLKATTRMESSHRGPISHPAGWSC
jgi:hypothetical protein